jgi:hypothetical protein
MNDESILELFRETQEGFTIYVVEQRFAVGRGWEYFKSFRGKNNYIVTDDAIKKLVSRVSHWMSKNRPMVKDLVSIGLNTLSEGVTKNGIGLMEAITILSKLFSVNLHQAVGPEVLDPIIMEEGKITKKCIAQLVALYKESILQPVIIILLFDNNFERVKDLLSQCPHGTNVKMIRNGGETIMSKVINCGAENTSEFINAFAEQCFSTCSQTRREVLINDKLIIDNPVVNFIPEFFRIRSSLILDEKINVMKDICRLIERLNSETISHDLLLCLKCTAHLYQVFCNDAGGEDIKKALSMANALDNELLKAQVFRYAFFFNDVSESEKIELMKIAINTFNKYNIADNAIYCKNNILIQDFYSEDGPSIHQFRAMQEEAANNVPGLVMMSAIYNNLGVAYLLSGDPDNSIHSFEKGLDYAKERPVQRLSLQSNRLIAYEYGERPISESDIRGLIKNIFDCNTFNPLPFIRANLVINVLSVTLRRFSDLAIELMRQYDIQGLFNKALSPNQMGSGSLCFMLNLLSNKYKTFDTSLVSMPVERTKVVGIRKQFIENNMYNPIIFHTWV